MWLEPTILHLLASDLHQATSDAEALEAALNAAGDTLWLAARVNGTAVLLSEPRFVPAAPRAVALTQTIRARFATDRSFRHGLFGHLTRLGRVLMPNPGRGFSIDLDRVA